MLHWVEGRSLDLQPSERKTFVLVNQLVGDEHTAAAEVFGSILADENCVIVVRNLSCFPGSARHGTASRPPTIPEWASPTAISVFRG